jgi:hypothetical protein
MTIKHLVQFSGGVCSWAAAKRVVERHGTDGVVLLFADTLIEDPTLYTFLEAAAKNVGAPMVKIADGRTPLELFKDVRYLGNSRKDPCSQKLKRELLNAWRKEHCDPSVTVTHFGLDWNEPHRLAKIRERHAPWRCEAYMTERPIMTKESMLLLAKAEGLSPCDLYDEGFPHANCGGACVKAGIAQWVHLLRKRPETFAKWRDGEEQLRQFLGKDISILRDRSGGKVRPLTLAELQGRIECKGAPMLFDTTDWGGCGCAVT